MSTNNINKLDELFRNGLDKAEFDAPEGLWNTIESGIQSQGHVAGQAGGMLAKGALLKVGSVLVAAGLALGTYLYFNSDQEPAPADRQQTEQVNTPPVNTADPGTEADGNITDHNGSVTENDRNGLSSAGADNAKAPSAYNNKGNNSNPNAGSDPEYNEPFTGNDPYGGIKQPDGKTATEAGPVQKETAGTLWFSLSDTVVCQDNTVFIVNKSSFAGDIKWTVNGITENTGAASFSYSFSKPGANTVTLSVGNRSVSRKVYVEHVEAGYSVTYLGKGRFRFVSNSRGAGSLTWDFGDRTPSASGKTVEHTFVNPRGEARYTIVLTAHGKGVCRDTFATDLINKYTGKKVVPAVPGSFSPNGDNINDKLEITWEGQGRCTLMIFDVNGNRVFETVYAGQQWWDGTSQSTGKPCPQGIYNLILNYEDEDGNFKRFTTQIMLFP